MGHKSEAVKPQTLDIGPGQYYKMMAETGGVTIPKAGRSQFFNSSDNELGPGQYQTNSSTLSKTGVSFKGRVAALHSGYDLDLK